jgi:hypothetical protein
MAQDITKEAKISIVVVKDDARALRNQWISSLPPVQGTFCVLVHTLTGKQLRLEGLTQASTVAELKSKIQDSEGLPPDQQRLIFCGLQLPDPERPGPGPTLVSLGLRDGDVLYLVIRLRGDIGIWSDSTSGSTLMCGSTKNDSNITTLPAGEIARLVHQRKGKIFNDEATCPKPVVVQNNVLSVLQCERLVKYVENAWDGMLEDFKIDLSPVELAELGVDFRQMEQVFGDVFNEIKLRRLSGQQRIIDYHLDVSQRTMQVALNENYVGGELTFIVGSQSSKNEMDFFTPQRPTGTCTIHDNTHVHGVKEMSGGVRYGLFFLKTDN